MTRLRSHGANGQVNSSLALSKCWTTFGIGSLQRKWRPYNSSKIEQRIALFRRLKDIFRRFISQPVNRVVELINPIVRGWVNYFAIGLRKNIEGWAREFGSTRSS